MSPSSGAFVRLPGLSARMLVGRPQDGSRRSFPNLDMLGRSWVLTRRRPAKGGLGLEDLSLGRGALAA
jgi:hypothetical protein